MSWSFVNASSNGTKTITKGVTAGNLLITGYVEGSSGSATPTVSSAAVSTWVQVVGSPVQDSSNGTTIAMYWAIANQTTTVAIAGFVSAGGTPDGVFFAEYSGNATSAPQDGGAGVANGTTIIATDGASTGAITTTADGDLIVSLILDASTLTVATTFSAGTGFTKRLTASIDPAGASEATFAFEDMVQSVQGAINPTWSPLGVVKYDGLSAGFKVLAGTTASNPVTFYNNFQLMGVM